MIDMPKIIGLNMGIESEKSFVMAEHLKQLREEKGLSHEKLSKALFNQYGVKISADSLINYEVATADHSKAYKNQGMRVEYLRCLADFYGVSADYLLGLSDYRTANMDLAAACAFTGLSESAVGTLHGDKEWGLGAENANVINLLLNDYCFHNIDARNRRVYRPVLNLLHYFFMYSNSGVRKQVFSNGVIADRGMDGYISSNAIELNDTVIENAVLAEIQQALLSLKRNMRENRE